jgi:hypothetical protein
MTTRTTRDEVRALRFDRERIAGLIGRYPTISPDETNEVLSFLRNGRHLDIGMLTSNDRLKPKLDAFMEEHKAHFRLSILESLAVMAAIGAFLYGLWLAAEAFF